LKSNGNAPFLQKATFVKIVLLGYMGSGKTTIGKRLATALEIPFLDLDHHIEVSENSTISEIFEAKGEIYFRKKEYGYLKKLLETDDDFVLSTGGGTPCYGQNMKTILEGTENVFYLKVSISELADRLLPEKDHRPLIKNIIDADLPEFIGKHLFERSFFYQRAHRIIDCDKRPIEDIVTEIKSRLV